MCFTVIILTPLIEGTIVDIITRNPVLLIQLILTVCIACLF